MTEGTAASLVEALEPCPFCGASDPVSWQPCNGGGYGITCRSCHTTQDSRMATHAEAVARWNTRHRLAALHADKPSDGVWAPEGNASEIGCICGDTDCREWLYHGDNAPRHPKPDWELMADGYKWRSGKTVHASDCATSNAPALEPGPCDCAASPSASQGEGLIDRPVNTSGVVVNETASDDTQTAPAIPAGMVEWPGGDSAPADWNGGRAMRRDGVEIDTSGLWRNVHWRQTGQSDDIIAYTPRADVRAAGEGNAEAIAWLTKLRGLANNVGDHRTQRICRTLLAALAASSTPTAKEGNRG